MAGVRLAAHQKKARRQDAHIALIDESGLLMAPLVRRTWAPQGQTPDFVQSGGGPPSEGLGRGGAVALAAPGSTGAVLPRRWPTATSTTGM